jgi:DNA repair protein RadC
MTISTPFGVVFPSKTLHEVRYFLFEESKKLLLNLIKIFCLMKVDYFTIPEITVSYKDRVKASDRAVVKCSKDAARILAVAFENCMEHHEEVYALFLNRANRVLGISNIAKGGIDGAFVDIRIILQTALKVSASAVMLSHNHPSGSTKPSSEDITLTKNIQKGCEAVGIQLLDHIVIAEESYASFADEGLL